MTINLSPTAVNDRNPNQLKYPIRESVAYLTIWSNIKNPTSMGISSKKTSKELWEHLQKEYTVEDKLHSLRYTDGKVTGTGGYAEKFRGAYKEAVDAGASIEEEQMLTIFIDSFPHGPEWATVLGNLATEDNFNIVALRLQEHVRFMSGTDGETVAGGKKVSAMQAEINELKERIVTMQASRKGPANPDLKCSNSNCKGVRHTIDNCFKLGGGKQGQYLKW
ncbi:hypothetical protein K435DRAFT_804090 [Dendrothele bispora CBS 962.96]|uniref:Uncharacterized protein n=1 Tax=Dendrothele bispora (strain CBS 962.96) TaxID=1314807 RepID=A0A4S8LFG7_DENBC|nr:hypothetical protein K435DRAFT_804090 [Dendrothele bispora CBS 962.96]